VNLVLAALVLIVALGFSGADLGGMVDIFSGGLLGRFAGVNLWLAAFNLIPAFPMDGGRALRALLAESTDYVRATRIAARLGQGLAILFALAGLFMNPMLRGRDALRAGRRTGDPRDDDRVPLARPERFAAARPGPHAGRRTT
jgi:Zn-dependent protease